MRIRHGIGHVGAAPRRGVRTRRVLRVNGAAWEYPWGCGMLPRPTVLASARFHPGQAPELPSREAFRSWSNPVRYRSSSLRARGVDGARGVATGGKFISDGGRISRIASRGIVQTRPSRAASVSPAAGLFYRHDAERVRV